MTDERRQAEPRHTTPFLLGQISQSLVNIEKQLARFTERADQADLRIAALELVNASKKWYEKIFEKALYAAGGGITILFFNGGLHI